MTLRKWGMLFALVGALDAGYLTLAYFAGVSVLPCWFRAAYTAVHQPAYAQVLSVPNSLIATAGYALLTLMICQGRWKAVRVLSISGTIIEAGLLCLSALIIGRVYPFCPFAWAGSPAIWAISRLALRAQRQTQKEL